MKARENPFATDRILQIRYRPQGPSWRQLLQGLADLQYRAAIVGPEGTGKTTLLEDLKPCLEELGYRVRYAFLNATDRTFRWQEMRAFCANLTRSDVILLDGAEQIGRFHWMRLKWQTAKAGGLIITSHREGMLPTLIRTQTSLELLRQIVDELLADQAAAVRTRLGGLFKKHGGNVRDVLRELYDIFASMDD